jgi:hypothetical protein
MSNHTEAELLEAMAHATLPEQRRISAELDDLRAIAAFNKVADAENDLANAIIEDHLTPVLVHGFHSTATDWLDEQVPDFTTADLHQIGTTMRAEASVWFSSVPEGVKANRSELREQARGIARRLGSQYGQVANQAADIFLEYVSRLVVADGTDLAGVPSAAGPTGREGGEDWSAGAPTLPVADGSTAPEDDAEGLNAPDPSVSGPAPESPTDSAPTSTRSLPEEDTHNNPGDAAATGEIPPATAFLSAQQRANRQYLGMEEGQDFSVPGERDPEQDGEAASSLPIGVDVTGAPDSFPSFVTPTPSKPAPSTRAPQMQGSLHEGAQCVYCGDKATHKHGADNLCDADWHRKVKRDASYTYAADHDPYADEHERWPEPGEGYPPTTSGDSQKPKHERFPEPGENYPPTTSGDSQKHAVSTGPNPQGSFVYDPIQVEAKGYEEGFAYALTWSPGKPVPAALTSAATIGNKYNAEYVTGYRNGVGEGIATLSTEFQAAFADAHKQQVLSTRRKEASDYIRAQHPDEDEYEYGSCDHCGKAVTGQAWGKKGQAGAYCSRACVDADTTKQASRRTALDRSAEKDCPDCDGTGHNGFVECQTCHGEGVVVQSSRRTADANTRDFNSLDQEVAFPFTWSGGGGKGAADVGSVPTPGSSVADYPQPSQASTPAVGTEVTATEPILDTDEDVPQIVSARRLAAAQRNVAASRLGFSGSRRVTADDRPVTEIYDEALYEGLDKGLSQEEAELYAERRVERTASKTAADAAKCGRTDLHGAHMSDVGFCVGNKGPRIVEDPISAHPCVFCGKPGYTSTGGNTVCEEHRNGKASSVTAGAYGDTGPYQQEWQDQYAELKKQTENCPHCKGAKTRTGDPEAICKPHRDNMRLQYATSPASENYWAS